MRRARKLTIEIEHREFTVALSLPRGSWSPAPNTGPATTSTAPSTCRACGATTLVPLTEALASYRGGQDALSRALTAGEIHISRSGSAIWLCDPSFKNFLATSPLDSKETPQ